MHYFMLLITSTTFEVVQTTPSTEVRLGIICRTLR